ncbi:MAG TPA: hypothetical protein VGH74_22660 [Planctomycetaceae bacterium]|jgi:hypothetical protein
MIRNWLTGLLAAVGLTQATAAVAQAYAVSLPVLAQIKSTNPNAKNYVVESLVVVALFGAALFVICKTSRRS